MKTHLRTTCVCVCVYGLVTDYVSVLFVCSQVYVYVYLLARSTKAAAAAAGSIADWLPLSLCRAAAAATTTTANAGCPLTVYAVRSWSESNYCINTRAAAAAVLRSTAVRDFHTVIE